VAADAAGRLLLTLDQGVVAVDLAKRRVSWAAPVAGCNDGPLPFTDDSVLVARAHGIGQYRNGHLTALSSGSAAANCGQLLQHPDGSVWCLDKGVPDRNNAAPATLIRLGAEVGDEHGTPVAYAAGRATSATWLPDGTPIIGGDPDLRALLGLGQDATVRVVTVRLPTSYASCMMPVGQERLLVVAGDGCMYVVTLSSGHSVAIGQFRDTEDSHFRLAGSASGAMYVARRYEDGQGDARVGVLRIDGSAGSAPVVPSIADVQEPRIPRVISQPARGSASVPLTPRRVSAPSVAGSSHAAPSEPARARESAAPRYAEQSRGRGDAALAARTLPLQAFHELVRVHFDLVRWLAPWQEHWHVIADGQAIQGQPLPSWVPSIATSLGSYAAPAGHIEAQFTPSPAYMSGFAGGLREVWELVLREQLVPTDSEVRAEWLRHPIRPAVRLIRGAATIADIRQAASRARTVSTTGWILRVVLWLMTLCWGITEIGAIGATIAGDMVGSVGSLVWINLLFAAILAGLIWLVVHDLRRLKKQSMAARLGQPDATPSHPPQAG
jgi:hypothetical protein